jgi:thymidylate synthase ThyX
LTPAQRIPSSRRREPGALIVGAIAAAGLSAGAAAAPDPPAAQAGAARVRPEARQGQGRAAAQQADRLDIAELQRLFDAYTVMQAQEALQLDDAQFGQFLPKLKALQDTRRRNEVARARLVAELGRLTAPSATLDEAAVRERLRELQDLEGRAAAELRRAYDTIDQQLDVRRQARFRVFEQNMERRKLQLMLRARRGAPGPPQ